VILVMSGSWLVQQLLKGNLTCNGSSDGSSRDCENSLYCGRTLDSYWKRDGGTFDGSHVGRLGSVPIFIRKTKEG